jgi:hypothetical protein
MTTRMSGTSGRWSLWLAVAFLGAMTSTLSAQQMVSKGGSAGSNIGQAGAASASTATLGSVSRIDCQAKPAFIGTCGTDTTVFPDPKPLHLRAHVMAARLYAAMFSSPGNLAMQLIAYRLWIQSTVDVLPPS